MGWVALRVENFVLRVQRGKEALLAILQPPDWTSDLRCDEGGKKFFDEAVTLEAESSANIWGDDADFVFRTIEMFGDMSANNVGDL